MKSRHWPSPLSPVLLLKWGHTCGSCTWLPGQTTHCQDTETPAANTRLGSVLTSNSSFFWNANAKTCIEPAHIDNYINLPHLCSTLALQQNLKSAVFIRTVDSQPCMMSSPNSFQNLLSLQLFSLLPLTPGKSLPGIQVSLLSSEYFSTSEPQVAKN